MAPLHLCSWGVWTNCSCVNRAKNIDMLIQMQITGSRSEGICCLLRAPHWSSTECLIPWFISSFQYPWFVVPPRSFCAIVDAVLAPSPPALFHTIISVWSSVPLPETNIVLFDWQANRGSEFLIISCALPVTRSSKQEVKWISFHNSHLILFYKPVNKSRRTSSHWCQVIIWLANLLHT